MPSQPNSVSIIIPTLNAANHAHHLIKALQTQTQKNFELIIIDSSSSDATVTVFKEAGATVEIIALSSFHHAGTRNHGARLASSDILVFLTQDALPHNHEWLESLISPILNGRAAASFARQIPYASASPLERFARASNYPDTSYLVTPDDIERLGVRAYFFSNSCSAVKRTIFEELDGFSEHSIMFEDMIFAAKLLNAGHNLAYTANAVVQHSHDYSLAQTFQRYFDVGVVFSQAENQFGRAGGEGLRYVTKLFTHLVKAKQYHWLTAAFMESAAKWVGLSLGKRHKQLPRKLVRKLSMHQAYWQ